MVVMVVLLAPSTIDGLVPSSSIRRSGEYPLPTQLPPLTQQPGRGRRQLLYRQDATGEGISSVTVPSPLVMAVATIVLIATVGMGPLVAVAVDDNSTAGPPSTTMSYSIERCSVSSQSPCVSTSNVRQIDLYSPPWTFATIPPNEVMSRLKGAVMADPSCRIIQQDGDKYLLVEAQRPADIFGTVDRLEFVINEQDEVVTYRSAAPTDSTGTDFGIQRRRLDEIRKRAGVFGLMGDTLNTADTKTSGERGNGPLGQLKAFYGLQSGGGFEDVLAE